MKSSYSEKRKSKRQNIEMNINENTQMIKEAYSFPQ